MTAEERSSATNGLWLCSNCHDLIDRDPEGYPTAALKKMKKEAEERVRKELGVATILAVSCKVVLFQNYSLICTQNKASPNTSADLINGISASAILEIRRTKAKFLEDMRKSQKKAAETALREVSFVDFEADGYLSDVGKEMILLLREIAHCKETAIALEVFRRLQVVAECFKVDWKVEEVKLICDVVEVALHATGSSHHSKVYQSGMALLKDQTQALNKTENKKKMIPVHTMKRLRESMKRKEHGAQEETDEGLVTDSDDGKASKRPRQEDDEYFDLMEKLGETSNWELVTQIESQLEEMGYEPFVQ